MPRSPHWSIIWTTSIWIILQLTPGHAETSGFSKCDLDAEFSSPLVSTYLKSLQPGQGCETNQTASRGQELHLIHLINPPDDGEDHRVTVRLAVHSRRHVDIGAPEGVSFQEGGGPMTFVLHSTRPVRWKVELYGLRSQEKHLFIVSRLSSIKFQKKTRIFAKSRERDIDYFGDKHKQLYRWATRKYGNVTSYSQVSDLNLNFYVGRDVNSPQQCQLDKLTPSLRLFSFQDQVKEIRGCRVDNHMRAMTKPAYIIELVSPPAPTPGITGVDLEILPYRDPDVEEYETDQIDRDLYLVVKSPPGVKWTLHSPNMPGYIVIVADVDVDIKGVKISSIASRRDVIEASGKDLIDWAQRYNLPVKLYAGVDGANSIKLRVPPSEIRLNQRRGKQASTSASTSSDKKEVAKPKDTEKSHRDARVRGHVTNLSDQEEILSSMIRTGCDNNFMVITVSKTFIKMISLDKNNITLKDPKCGLINETDEHIILKSGQGNCGTRIHFDHGAISFFNELVIHTSPGLVTGFLHEELGSGFFDDDEGGSGTHDGGVYLDDDEDLSSKEVRLSLECRSPLTQQKSVAKSELSQSQSKCQLDLYEDRLFLRRKSRYPAYITKGKTVYLKASLTATDKTAQIDSCWLSPHQSPHTDPAKDTNSHVIIKDGCLKNSQVKWLDSTDGSDGSNIPYIKFSLTLTSGFTWLKDTSKLYLHCSLWSCDRRQGDRSKCPVDVVDRCHVTNSSVSKYNDHLMCGPLTVGPLELTDKELHMKPSAGGHDTNSVSAATDTSSGEHQKIIIEGLDAVTVVCIAFAAFAIGIILMGALWFIHTHTGHTKRGTARHGEAEASADLSPNSTSPWTA